MSVLVRPAQISGLADPDRGFHPVPAQNSRRMLLTKVSVDLNRILGTYKELNDKVQERAEERRRSGAPEPDSGAPEPVVDPSASPRAEEAETLVDRLAREEVARQQERAYVEGKKGAMEKYRISDECPDAECQRRHGRTRLEIDPDGNAGCPRCGYYERERRGGDAERRDPDREPAGPEHVRGRQRQPEAHGPLGAGGQEQGAVRDQPQGRAWGDARSDLVGQQPHEPVHVLGRHDGGGLRAGGRVWDQRHRGRDREAVAAAGVHRRRDGPGGRLRRR